MEPIMWRPFLLLDLPVEYDVLFSRYFQRVCINCNKHALECGRDACCFLALNSSLIVVVREGKSFNDRNDVKRAVEDWIASRSSSFWRDGIAALPDHWGKVVATDSD
ncbi:unnamed protein product [Heligmosomoides polygyrus]|uniref:DUF4471 domain-containing protein n=1 Tax=Heligmosomoides polygyrus TaxID=6339 RepID=A0A3P7XDW4_HELPZ|nr:unnamed protein product [Heligmosomoides polygyrus]